MEKKIVIVGAGYAGILTAKKLAKNFKKRADISITIIDKNPYHTMLTELHEVAANRVDEDSIKMGLKKIFAGRKVNVRLDTVNAIDFEKKQVIGLNESYSYDYLALAAGSKPTFFGVPGAEEFSYKLWSYEDAVILKDHIHNCFRKAVSEKDPEIKKKLLTFYVVGAGFTGVEMVGELAEYVPILCETFEIDRELVSIHNIDILSRTVPILPEKLSNKVEKRLKKMGVSVMLNTNVTAIGSDFIETEAEGKTARSCTATVIWAAGVESADITVNAAKALQSEGRGRIKVDSFLRSLDNENVYVAGDNMFYIPEGERATVPQTVENCELSSAIVAHNITHAITGKGQMKEYKPAFHGTMVSIGGRYGVARVGFPAFMVNLPSFFAMFTKHLINIVYFVQVLGWNKIFSYLKHEFFTIRNRRSFVGGHFSNRTPSFLLVPLRLWLGAVWLFEGVIKIFEGWLNTPKLTAFFGGANSWFNSILNNSTDGVSGATGAATNASDTITAATDAVTAATDAAYATAEAVGTTIFHFNFAGLFQTIFVSGKELTHSSISDFAFKLDVPFVNFIINDFILPNDSVQIAMQAFIVIAEILIGLALIGGLFTFPASGFSLVLQFMFVTTTGLYLTTFWMIFAAIALLIGGGRTFGLDYYVLPYLKSKWRRIPFVRRLYLYND